MPARRPVRIVLLVICVWMVALGLSRHSALSACTQARTTIEHHAFHPGGPAPDWTAVASRVKDDCHDAQLVAQASGGLVLLGRLHDAENLARTAIARAPDDGQCWIALALVLGHRHDSAGQRLALARAHALNPLSQLARP
jgi:Flp pilus assembly protein TadD